MFGKYIKIGKILLSNLKSLWITHLLVFSLYIFEIFTLGCIFLWYITPHSDYDFSFIEILIMSHYISFMLFGEFALALVCLYLVIKFIFKKSFIVKNAFLIKNNIYYPLWLLGCIITTTSLISIILWFIHLLSEELQYF